MGTSTTGCLLCEAAPETPRTYGCDSTDLLIRLLAVTTQRSLPLLDDTLLSGVVALSEHVLRSANVHGFQVLLE
jgi:hypothetical protein